MEYPLQASSTACVSAICACNDEDKSLGLLDLGSKDGEANITIQALP